MTKMIFQIKTQKIEKHRKSLFNYFLFLRITPLLPNWFINISSPLFSVPLSTFAVGTYFGIMPATFFAVQAGLALQELETTSQVFNWKLLLTLFALGFISLIPTLDSVQQKLDSLLNRK